MAAALLNMNLRSDFYQLLIDRVTLPKEGKRKYKQRDKRYGVIWQKKRVNIILKTTRKSLIQSRTYGQQHFLFPPSRSSPASTAPR